MRWGPANPTKRRRSSDYIPPRTIPTSFTSVTGSFAGAAFGTGSATATAAVSGSLRRNLSFSRIDPYVSYARTGPITGSGSSGSKDNNVNSMDMNDSSSGQTANNQHHGCGDQRVRSMSF